MSPRYDLAPEGDPYEIESTGYALVRWGAVTTMTVAVGAVAFFGGIGPVGGGGGGSVGWWGLFV